MSVDDPKFTHDHLLELIWKHIDQERQEKVDLLYNKEIGNLYGSKVSPGGPPSCYRSLCKKLTWKPKFGP